MCLHVIMYASNRKLKSPIWRLPNHHNVAKIGTDDAKSSDAVLSVNRHPYVVSPCYMIACLTFYLAISHIS